MILTQFIILSHSLFKTVGDRKIGSCGKVIHDFYEVTPVNHEDMKVPVGEIGEKKQSSRGVCQFAEGLIYLEMLWK